MVSACIIKQTDYTYAKFNDYYYGFFRLDKVKTDRCDFEERRDCCGGAIWSI
jgi:hypothetical protein